MIAENRLRYGVFLLLLSSLVAPAAIGTEELAARGARAVAEERWEDALSVYEELTRTEPDNPGHWEYLGLALRSLDRDPEASAAYRSALERNENSLRALAGLAITLAKTERFDEAFDYLTRFAELGVGPETLEQNPAFEPLRGQERFTEIVEIARRTSLPCEHLDPYDDFDFWVGDWDVWVAGERRARNVITREMSGCIVRERYSNEFGYSGESLNYYDPESKSWKQTWVDSRGGVVRYEGSLERDGVMRMEGTNSSANGTTQLARVTWTKMEDGRVHHVIEQSADGGRTWQGYFDGIYTRR